MEGDLIKMTQMICWKVAGDQSVISIPTHITTHNWVLHVCCAISDVYIFKWNLSNPDTLGINS